MPLLIKGLSSFDIFFAILYIGEFWVLIIKRIFKGSLCIFNIGLTFGVFATLDFKLECSCFVIRSFYFSLASFLFIATLSCLMVSVLSFLYLSDLFNSCSTILCTCFLLIMHIALTLSASNKHKSLLLSHLLMSLQSFSPMFVSDLFLDFFKMLQQSKRNALLVLIVGNVFAASSIPAIMSNTGMFFVAIL